MVWKDIKGYEGFYEISDNGDVRNKKTGHILKPRLRARTTKNSPGYKFVNLCRNSQDHKKHNIHRLVALNFIPNPNNLPVVMHKDNNTLNCNVNNLEWGTIGDNIRNAHRDGLCKDAREKIIYDIYKGKEDSVICYGCKDVLNTIESKSNASAVVSAKIRDDTTISKGPYKGYKIRKLINGITYE